MTNLIPPHGRWTIKHKARLVAAVVGGELSLADLVAAGITVEEFTGWKDRLAALYGTHPNPGRDGPK